MLDVRRGLVVRDDWRLEPAVDVTPNPLFSLEIFMT
jgi:hypothetical protein